jgi:hypothetical protein
MKTKHLLPFCLLITAILITCVQGIAGPNRQAVVAAPLSNQDVDPLELSGNSHFIVLTKDEVVYMLSRENQNLESWSVVERKYLPTISLAAAPDLITYSEEVDSIYLSYPNNRITEIKLDEKPLRETPFTTTLRTVEGMTMAGSFFFTSDSLKHNTYNPQGILISQVDRTTPGAYHVWSPANHKLYYFIDPIYPSDFQWDEIGLDGIIAESIEPPHHSEEYITSPLRVKPDGSLLFFGSGTILDATTLEKKHILYALSGKFSDALWHDDDLITAEFNQANRNTLLKKWEYPFDGLAVSKEVPGFAIRIFKVAEGILVISRDDNNFLLFTILDFNLNTIYETPFFYSYFPLVDKDFCGNIYDDFSNPTTGWPVGEDNDVLSEYLEGEYRVLTKNDTYFYMFRSPGCEHQYFQLEVDARWVGEPGFAYGLVYGINEDWSQYNLFIINTDYREFGYYVYINDYLNEYSYQSTPAIYPSTLPNHLKVTRRFENLILEINGTIVLDTNDPDNIGPRSVGLVVIPYDGYPIADTRFDNFAKRFLTPDEIYQSGTIGASFEENCVPVTNPIPGQQLKSESSIIYNP